MLFFQISQHHILSRSHWEASLVPTGVAVPAQRQDTNWWQQIKLLWQHLLINTVGLSFARQKSSASLCSCKAVWKVTNFCNQILCEYYKNLYPLASKMGCSHRLLWDSLGIHVSAQTRAVSWRTFPFLPHDFYDKSASCQEIPSDCVNEVLFVRGREGKVFYFNLCQLLNIFIQACAHPIYISIRYAEVVTHFAAKPSVAQQTRNGELRSCTCLVWLKTYLWSRKFSHWTLVLSQRHNTPTHRHKNTKIKLIQGSDGKAWSFLNLMWPFKTFCLVLTLVEVIIDIRYKRNILHTFSFFLLLATFLSLDLRWVSGTEHNWKLFLKEGLTHCSH